jgi:ubiquinone/menaquinone biosynthesis C-methylase UbiE
MRTTFLANLHCPYSGSSFEVRTSVAAVDGSVRYGVVRSEAGDFPIVDGILRLLIDELRAPLVDMIGRGEFERALLVALEVPHHERGGAWLNMAGRIAYRAGMGGAAGRLMSMKRAMCRLLTDPNKTFVETIKQLSAGRWRHWQLYRFSMPTFLPVFPLVQLLKRGPVLDFGCGLGHAAFLIGKSVPGSDITGVDYSYSSLYMARKFFVKEGNFVCLDGDYPLPFASNYFHGIFSSDALHCMDSKVTIASELLRTLTTDGTLVMPHLHNKLSPVQFGRSLTPNGYRRLFESIECRVLPEEQVVRQYLKAGELDLTVDGGDNVQHPSVQGVSLVASRDTSVFRRYTGLAETHIESIDNPVVNPVYRATARNGHWRLSKHADDWCAASIPVEDEIFLPEQWELNGSTPDRISLRALKQQDPITFAALARKLVVVDVPTQYV